MLKHFMHSTLALSALLMGEVSQARDITIPYTGRFIEANAKPVEGSVDIVIEFFAKDVGGTSLASPQSFPAVVLEDGVFQLNISLSSAEFHKMVPSVDSPLWIQVTDATNGAIYPRQAMATSAFALKVPVDGTTISWNSEGQLELNKNAAFNKVGGQTFVTSGASAGQVLGWDAASKTWKPTSVSLSPSGIANGSISGDKISSGTISNFASTGIDDNAASKAITINSGGNVGIGTTTPTNLLNVVSNSPGAGAATFESLSNAPSSSTQVISLYKKTTVDMTDNHGPVIGFYIEDDTSGKNYIGDIGMIRSGADNSGRFVINTENAGVFAEKMTVLPNGNVGIGTASPVNKLEIRNSTPGNYGLSAATDNGGRGLEVVSQDYAYGATGSSLSLNLGAGSGDTYAMLSAHAAGKSTPANLVLNPNGGNVGIGTTIPSSSLDVVGSALSFGDSTTLNTSKDFRLLQRAYDNNKTTVVYSYSNPAENRIMLGGGTNAGYAATSVEFRTSANSTTLVGTERMRIDNAGNVGIGTTNPQMALEVNGGLRLNTAGAKPVCDSTKRGSLYVEQGAATFTDTVYICLKSAADTYSWITSTTGG